MVPVQFSDLRWVEDILTVYRYQCPLPIFIMSLHVSSSVFGRVASPPEGRAVPFSGMIIHVKQCLSVSCDAEWVSAT